MARETIERAADGRKSTRPIPIPRRVLRFLAKCRKPALVKTFLAYLIRGLSLNRKSGEVKGAGTVKASWISGIFAISERAVRAARQELIRLGWIDKDTGSKQRKLNRDGAYFQINLNWRDPTGVLHAGNGSDVSPIASVENSPPTPQRFAPPNAQKGTQFAPPLERLETLSDPKNQKLTEREPSGFCGVGTIQDLVRSLVTKISVDVHPPEENPASTEFGAGPPRTQKLKPSGDESVRPKPNLKNIQPEDIRRLSRLKVLYEQAIKAGWLERSEANFLNFAGAAVRANRAAGDSVRIFVAIVKRKQWGHITQGQEEQARYALKWAT
jgi:hypothetical protein